METTKIPLAACVESSYQNRKELGDVSGLARSIEVNGQITPLIVVGDGESYQLVAGHRRTAAMRSLGIEEADAYVMDGWDDARIAQILNAENNHRRELTEAERGRGIQTMLSLGVPVSDAAVSADIPEDRAESYVRGSKVVPVDAVNLDFDAVALMGDYDDVLTEDDVVAVLSKKSHWDRQAVCQAARARAAAESAKVELEERGIRVVEKDGIDGADYHRCDGECGHAGLVATVSPNRWGENASVTFYCDDESHVYQPTPEEVAAEEAYEERCASYSAMRERITEFAKEAFPKFPAKGQSKLRQWAWEAFEEAVSATAKSAERATLSRRRRPRFPAGGATALWPPALPRAAAQGALDRGVVEVRGPDLNLQRRGALGVPGRDRPARDLPSAELREPDRHRDVLCAERGQPPRGVRGPHDCPLSGSPSPSAASASRSFMR